MTTNILSGPEWAHGCVHCTYGVRDEHYAPPTGVIEISLERLISAERIGPAYFCDCRAGQALRSYLRRIREQYQDMTMRLGPHKQGNWPNEPTIEHVEIGKIILAHARHAMQQPHVTPQPAPEERRKYHVEIT